MVVPSFFHIICENNPLNAERLYRVFSIKYSPPFHLTPTTVVALQQLGCRDRASRLSQEVQSILESPKMAEGIDKKFDGMCIFHSNASSAFGLH